MNGLSDLAPQLCTSLIDWSSLCGSDASVPSTTWNVSVSFRLLPSTSLGGQGGHFLPFDSPRSRCQSQESRAAQEHIKGQEQLARMFSCPNIRLSVCSPRPSVPTYLRLHYTFRFIFSLSIWSLALRPQTFLLCFSSNFPLAPVWSPCHLYSSHLPNQSRLC